ncbi:MAG: ribonuclease HI family protein [Methanomassiliicoccales archaeon]|nr:ribonuclease HI family protein [Methanomassiliicoccales archaeon]
MKFRLYSDGGSRGNPGDSAYAYIICDEKGKEVGSGSNFLGTMTNNEAEYHGLLSGLKEIIRRGGTEVEVFMDSELAIKQLKGLYQVKAPNLVPLYDEALRILESMSMAKVTHLHRENEAITKADAMVNWTLDQHALARQLHR